MRQSAALVAFKKLLRAMDKEIGNPPSPMFAYGIKQMGDNTFLYVFDGLVWCQLTVHKDHTVTESIEGQLIPYKSVLAWAEAAVKQINEY